ncbi:hypothetical protein WN943_022938 [Citrus x changshan-huyou]
MQECKGSPTAIKFCFEPVNERNREVGNVVAVLVGIAMGHTLPSSTLLVAAALFCELQKMKNKSDSFLGFYILRSDLEHLTKCQSLNEELKQVNDKHLRKEEMKTLRLKFGVDEQHKEAEQLRDLTSARNVETLKLKIMKLRRRRSLKENSLLLKRARIQVCEARVIV